MDKLEVGMYVRFDNVICQIEEVEEDYLCFDIGFYDHWNELTYSMKYKDFVEEYKPKFANNIIDLIGVGDYVNGHLVEDIKKVPNEEIDRVIVTTTAEGWDGETLEIYKEEIKTIVTKEQFESMEYRLGE